MSLWLNQSSAKIILIISTVIWGLLFLLSLPFAGISAMLSESRSSPTWFVGSAILSAWCLPLIISMSLVLSWILYSIQRYVAAVGVTLIPVLNIGVIVLSWVLLDPYLR